MLGRKLGEQTEKAAHEISHGIYLLSDKLGNEALDKAIQKVEADVEKVGGRVQREADGEAGTAARVIKKQSAGTFVEITFELDPDKVSALNAAHKLDDNVLRSMVTHAKKPAVGDKAPGEKEVAKDGVS